MQTSRRSVLALLIAALFFTPRSPASAQVEAALQFSSDGGFANGYVGTLGWQFTATQNLTLTAFGIYNAGLPVTTPHTVGLFDLSGTLLDSGMVGPASVDTVDNFFDFASTTPYNLQAGHSYILGELLSADDFYYYAPSSVKTATGVTYVQTQYDPTNTSGLTFPGSTDFPDNGYGYFGPNFLAGPTSSVTPEPSSALALVVFLAGGGIGRLWRGRRRGARNGSRRSLLLP